MTLHDKTPVETAIIRPDGISGRDTVSREFNLNHSTVNSSLQNRKAVPEIIVGAFTRFGDLPTHLSVNFELTECLKFNLNVLFIRTSIDDVIKHWSLLRQLASAHLKLWCVRCPSPVQSTVYTYFNSWVVGLYSIGCQLSFFPSLNIKHFI
jgi:hypothetical protein